MNGRLLPAATLLVAAFGAALAGAAERHVFPAVTAGRALQVAGRGN